MADMEEDRGTSERGTSTSAPSRAPLHQHGTALHKNERPLSLADRMGSLLHGHDARHQQARHGSSGSGSQKTFSAADGWHQTGWRRVSMAEARRASQASASLLPPYSQDLPRMPSGSGYVQLLGSAAAPAAANYRPSLEDVVSCTCSWAHRDWAHHAPLHAHPLSSHASAPHAAGLVPGHDGSSSSSSGHDGSSSSPSSSRGQGPRTRRGGRAPCQAGDAKNEP
jgi:hypothetical protein